PQWWACQGPRKTADASAGQRRGQGARQHLTAPLPSLPHTTEPGGVRGGAQSQEKMDGPRFGPCHSSALATTWTGKQHIASSTLLSQSSALCLAIAIRLMPTVGLSAMSSASVHQHDRPRCQNKRDKRQTAGHHILVKMTKCSPVCPGSPSVSSEIQRCDPITALPHLNTGCTQGTIEEKNLESSRRMIESAGGRARYPRVDRKQADSKQSTSAATAVRCLLDCSRVPVVAWPLLGSRCLAWEGRPPTFRAIDRVTGVFQSRVDRGHQQREDDEW
ncbi:hypothetical protein K456DRAFT_1909800, partial [Colletotrichum gloeosporioides 23]